MKFISVIALLAPAVLAAPQAEEDSRGWIGLIKEKCPDMSQQCLDLAKHAHDPAFDIIQAGKVAQTMPSCDPAYLQCINNLTEDSDTPSTAQNAVTCVLQIAPDHFKYFLDNDSAEIPIPRNQNCPLRELHRVAHVELGPLA
ncbi:hypothetical protein BDV30DRAFT_235640 [Aspergillus minisclerotigenes]|uniref:Uncharacterized protein n=1 Tax=Aspergillus minisclerotigenes TaxID=656917 RepID=A0A5N6JE54_9EURO|nr:hypothetical protein BDV30DRAFT_235640 [Aspergillus minisclerotigenes]